MGASDGVVEDGVARRGGGRRWLAVLVAVTALVVGCSSGEGTGPSSADGTSTSSGDADGAGAQETTASTACAEGGEVPVLDRIDVTVDGVARTSLVHLPAGWDGASPLPVVVSFHGAGSDAATMAVIDGLDALADVEGFVVLRPEGLPVDLSSEVRAVAGWDLAGAVVDDAAFVASLLDEVGGLVCVDPSRTHAVGFSLGGDMAMALACSMPERIAGHASVGAGRTVPCEATSPRPALSFHGTADLVVPYDGDVAQGIEPIERVMAVQAERNGCTGGPEVDAVTETVEALTWTGCEAETVLYRLAGHGHAWPGRPLPFSPEIVAATLAGPPDAPNPIPGAAGLSPAQMAENVLLTNVDVDATALMWELFSASE